MTDYVTPCTCAQGYKHLTAPLKYSLKRSGNLGMRPAFIVRCVYCFLLVSQQMYICMDVHVHDLSHSFHSGIVCWYLWREDSLHQCGIVSAMISSEFIKLSNKPCSFICGHRSPLSICLSTFCVRGGWPVRLLSAMWRYMYTKVNQYKVPAMHFIGLSY